MQLAILGSTGSIGRNTLQVVRELETPPQVVALAAGHNVDELVRQALEFRPDFLSVADAQALDHLQQSLASRTDYNPQCVCGPEGILKVAQETDYDVLVSAAVGVAGLEATYAAIQAGKRIALANKEVLVVAGELVMAAARQSNTTILPVDSEHNAIHQCMRTGAMDEIERLILTASGGPFRTTPIEELALATPESALQHPTWQMGNRITIDSATMMNKGFEVIEACLLFGLSASQVEVVIHPQSIVHAMVEFRDGSLIAQLSPPDMKLPIRYALTYPARETSPRERLDWSRVPQLDFETPDSRKFPLLGLAYKALRIGGTAGCILNAADEVAVAAFLEGRIPYLAIARVIEETLSQGDGWKASSIQEMLVIDSKARAYANSLLDNQSKSFSLPNR